MFESLIGSLFTPALYVAGAIGLTAIADPQYLYVAGVSVATEVEERGYSHEESVSRLVNAIVMIDQKAKRIQPSKQIAVLDASSPVEIIGNQLNVTPFIRVVQHAAGVADKSLSGAITVTDGDEIEFTVRVARDDGGRVTIIRKGQLKDLDNLFHDVAYDIYRVVAPYSYALLELEKALGNRDFRPVQAHITHMIKSVPHVHERAWFHNLKGLVEAIEGDEAGAQHSFTKALAESPTPFPLGRLNLGYAKFLAGDDAGAIEEYRQGLIILGAPFETHGILRTMVDASVLGVTRVYNGVIDFRDRTPRPLYSRPALMAALLTAWGVAEERLGRNECAEALFAMAIKADAADPYARGTYMAFLRKNGRDADADRLVSDIYEIRSESHEDLPSLLRLRDKIQQRTHASR